MIISNNNISRKGVPLIKDWDCGKEMRYVLYSALFPLINAAEESKTELLRCKFYSKNQGSFSN